MILDTMSVEDMKVCHLKERDEIYDRLKNKYRVRYRSMAVKATKYPFCYSQVVKTRAGNTYIAGVNTTSRRNARLGIISILFVLSLETSEGKMHVLFAAEGRSIVIFFTTHFFRRYKERLGLPADMSMKDTIKRLASYVGVAGRTIPCKRPNGQKYSLVPVADGAIICVEKNGRYYAKTFISKDDMSAYKFDAYKKGEKNIIDPEELVKIYKKNH